MICFTEVRFLQTYSPLRWLQRPGLFQPFPSLKRSLRPSELLFSIKRDTKSPQGSMDLGEDLISLVCLVLNAIALVRCGKSENFDAINVGWLGVFIALTTKLAVW
jgi:hypothetical protein